MVGLLLPLPCLLASACASGSKSKVATQQNKAIARKKPAHPDRERRNAARPPCAMGPTPPMPFTRDDAVAEMSNGWLATISWTTAPQSEVSGPAVVGVVAGVGVGVVIVVVIVSGK